MQLSMQALESHSISQRLTIKQGDEWKECSLSQSMPQVIKCARDALPKPATSYL